MSRRVSQSQAEAPGQDSFLDVVANLVGVMIILVMVVGTQARNVVSDITDDSETETSAIPNIAASRQKLATQERAATDLLKKMKEEELEIALRRRERDQIMLLVTAGEKQIALAKDNLSQQERTELDLKNAVNTAQYEIENLDKLLIATQAAAKTTEVLKHYPTPMAKTVFGKELHFCLADQRLIYVPFEELVEQLKNEAPKRMWKLRETDRIVEKLAPLNGFEMRYALKREQVVVQTNGGAARQERATLDHFILLPVQANLGEPVNAALAANSDFRHLLQQYDPKRFTVTVWVYPESFGQFRLVREELMKLGFTTAARPMPSGQPIGGSPEGSRSASQ